LDKKEVGVGTGAHDAGAAGGAIQAEVHWATKEGDVYNLVVVKAVRLQSTGAPPARRS